MEILTGAAVCAGVAVAEAVVLEAEDYRIPQRTVAASAVDGELGALDRALEAAVSELQRQCDELAARSGKDAAEVFRWHIGVLQDRRLRGDIEALLRKKRSSAAYATSTVMRNQQRRFMQMSNPLLAERIRDVQDIERRLLRLILGEFADELLLASTRVIPERLKASGYTYRHPDLPAALAFK